MFSNGTRRWTRPRPAGILGRCGVVVALLLGVVTPVAVATATGAAAATCPCTIWPSTATPAVLSDTDTSAVELGVKFRSDTAGFIPGVRFRLL